MEGEVDPSCRIQTLGCLAIIYLQFRWLCYRDRALGCELSVDVDFEEALCLISFFERDVCMQ